MRWWLRIGLTILLALALLETRLFLTEEESRGLVALVLVLGAVAGLLLARWIPPGATLAAGAVGLVLFYPLVLASLVASALEGAFLDWPARVVWVLLLATPVTVAALAASRLAAGLTFRWATGAAGAAVAAGLALAVAAPGADWLDEPPPARYAVIDDARGAYGLVALGDSRDQLFAAFGRRPRASLDEPFSPTGAEDVFEGPTFVPMSSRDFYRYEDVVFWFEDGRVKGFELTSPGARTSSGIGVGSDLEDVRDAYPELACDEAPAGDIATYPYCAGRLGPERWVWFGGDPVSTVTFSSGGFE